MNNSEAQMRRRCHAALLEINIAYKTKIYYGPAKPNIYEMPPLKWSDSPPEKPKYITDKFGFETSRKFL